MFNDLTAMGYGLVVFAVIIGVGSLVLYNFASSNACGSLTWNATSSQCVNATGGQFTPTGQVYTNLNYMLGQLGSGGLAGWVPAIIAISVGLLFLGAFLFKGKKGRY